MEAVTATPDGNTAAPATFAEAFAAEASSATDPSGQSSPPAAAAEQPTEASETTPAQTDERSPFIPRTRFDEVNGKYNELKAWKEQYGWVEQVDRAQVEQAIALAQRYQRDRVGFLTELAQEIQDHPEFGPQLRSMAARTLAAARGSQAPGAAEPPPLVPVQLEDGTVVQMPRDPQAWLQWHQQQWLAQVEQKMAPALTAAQKLQQQEAAQLAGQWSANLMADVEQTYGDIKPYRADILQELQRQLASIPKDDPRQNSPEFLEALTLKAVTKVMLPKLTQRAQSEQLDELQRKASASAVPSPGSATPSVPRDVKGFNDPRLQW